MFVILSTLLGWLHWTGDAIGCGIVVALALVCLLQYLLQRHYASESRKENQRFQNEINQLTTERDDLQHGQQLAELENRILREFVSSSNTKKATELLLKYFAPNPLHDFAALLFVEESCLVIEQSRGLSKASARDFWFDLPNVSPLTPGKAALLRERELRQSVFWARLAAEDRKKASEIILLPICKGEEVFGVLLTTALHPPMVSRTEQLALALRLMGSISGNLRQRLVMKRHEHEIRQTQDVLKLRSITDATYEAPLDMVNDYLREMQSILKSDSATLYLRSNTEGEWNSMARCEEKIPPLCIAQWRRYEALLLEQFDHRLEYQLYDPNALRRAGIETLLQSVLLVPHRQEERTTGIFCIARRGASTFDDSQRDLALWAADHLGKSLLKLQTFADIKLQAKQDGLTELANRRSFDEQLERELRVAQRAGVECSLLLCDLDRFKAVNDTFGHQAGDKVLRIVARILNEKASKTPARERALTARYGGEEIAIILPGQGEEIAWDVAEEIRQAVSQAEIWWQKMPIQVTISIGVATFPTTARNAASLISAADSALYRAKSQGRNRVNLADGITQPVSMR